MAAAPTMMDTSSFPAALATGAASDVARQGLKQYYITKIEELQLTVSEKNQNLRRLQAQRNELNAKVSAAVLYGSTMEKKASPDDAMFYVSCRFACCVRSSSCCRSRVHMWEKL